MHQLLGELSSAELTEWMAYEQLEPFGETRADLRAGIVASTVANHGMAELKRPARPSDYMPFMEKAEPAGPVLLQDAEKQSALILATMFPKRKT